MSFEKSWPFALLVACGVLAVGCSAESGEVSNGGEDVVGVGNLSLLEKTFGLVSDQKINGAWSRDVTAGACYAAYAAGDASVEVRRYENGAAFFNAREEHNRERGDDRPVLCVDLDRPGMSLDGVALDAVFRFDLGKPVGTDASPGGEVYIEHERGKLHVLVTDSIRGPSKASVAALRSEHGSRLVASPTFIGGSLVDVTVRDAKVLEPMSGETHAGELVVSGSLAAFAYAAAYAKTGSAFSLTRDPLGIQACVGLTGGSSLPLAPWPGRPPSMRCSATRGARLRTLHALAPHASRAGRR